MERANEQLYLDILKRELVPALGCTEPIAIAYASAKAGQVLGEFPKRMEIRCSGNIIKNVKGVQVPHAGGMRGVDTAAVLGLVGGNPDRELEVLEDIKPEHLEKTKELLAQNFFSCSLQENVDNLYIVASVYSDRHQASVTIVNRHTLITEIQKDGKILYHTDIPHQEPNQTNASWKLTVRNILDFAQTVDLELVKPILDRQIQMNTAIAQEGITASYGAQIGRVLLDSCGHDVRTRARAMAAAGSDARMGGCSLPVVINSGSGNQGVTVTLPVLEYAKEWNVSKETIYRALLISNLISIHQKHYIGSLSAFCGAVTAACGAGAAITYMAGGSYEEISRTIVNTLANVGGIVCDGAKSSCAAKIASAVEAAIMGYSLSMRGICFQPGEGMVQQDVEGTIQSMGHIGREGMRSTDIEILHIMMNQVSFEGNA